MILPCVTIGYAFPFGGGAGGGLLGTLLGGTLTGTIGCIVGGVAIGYLVKCCINGREKSYDFIFGNAQRGTLFQDKGESQADGTISIPAEISRTPYKTAEDIINSAQPGKESDTTIQYINPEGSFEKVNNDFDDLPLIDIQDKGRGVRVGKLPDGRTVVARPVSSNNSKNEGGFPTLEFQPREDADLSEKTIKIRYTGK